MGAKILILEDEEDIRELIHFHFFKEKFQIFLAADGAQAWNLAQKERPDCFVLDVMVPLIDGIELCKKIRAYQPLAKAGIILLTAKSTEEDIIRGFQAGADDYVVKPFGPKVLMARAHALLKRLHSAADRLEGNKEVLVQWGIEINAGQRRVRVDGQNVDLTFTEFQLLHLIMQRPGWVFSRDQIVNLIRGSNHAITDRSVDVQVVSLRKKLGEKGKLIETVRGIGYRLKDD